MDFTDELTQLKQEETALQADLDDLFNNPKQKSLGYKDSVTNGDAKADRIREQLVKNQEAQTTLMPMLSSAQRAMTQPLFPPTPGFDDPVMRVLLHHFGRVDRSSSSSLEESSFPLGLQDSNFTSACVLCGFTGEETTTGYPRAKKDALPPISRAHLISDKDTLQQCNITNDEGNYLSLCGTKRWTGTCHRGLYTKRLLLLYIGDDTNDGRYMIVASHEHYKHLNGKVVKLSPKVPRKVLQAHALLCLNTFQVSPKDDILALIRVKKWHAELERENDNEKQRGDVDQ